MSWRFLIWASGAPGKLCHCRAAHINRNHDLQLVVISLTATPLDPQNFAPHAYRALDMPFVTSLYMCLALSARPKPGGGKQEVTLNLAFSCPNGVHNVRSNAAKGLFQRSTKGG